MELDPAPKGPFPSSLDFLDKNFKAYIIDVSRDFIKSRSGKIEENPPKAEKPEKVEAADLGLKSLLKFLKSMLICTQEVFKGQNGMEKCKIVSAVL